MSMNWDDKRFLAEAEGRRERMRAKGKRLAFDCYNLLAGDKRARCVKGHLLGQVLDGSVPVAPVLQGVTPSVCRDCLDYDDSP